MMSKCLQKHQENQLVYRASFYAEDKVNKWNLKLFLACPKIEMNIVLCFNTR